MNSAEHWLSCNSLSPVEVDCATAVMLKIIDGKCKMPANEKVVMAQLYDSVKNFSQVLLAPPVHSLIALAREGADEELRLQVYEQRVLAETMISRPTMKAFKARIRSSGLLD